MPYNFAIWKIEDPSSTLAENGELTFFPFAGEWLKNTYSYLAEDEKPDIFFHFEVGLNAIWDAVVAFRFLFGNIFFQ